jgi:hypothetical protein
VLGPVLFGVAHVAADVRYLVLRQELSRWWRRAIVAASATLIALRVVEESHLRPTARLEFAFASAFALCAVGAAVAARGRPRRAAAAASVVLGMGVAAVAFPELAQLALLHAHNLVALALLFLLFPARVGRLAAPLLLIAAFAVALAAGAGYRLTLASSGVQGFHRHVLEIADWVAPGLRADYAIGVTSAYVFLQSVHYLIWLFLIPQRAQRGEGTLTFAMTARSLIKDFGAIGLTIVVVLALSVLCAAAFDAPRAQRTYLSLAMFHAYLELSMLSYLWVLGKARD